jgi:SAM-dependent methyltransferase
MSPHPKDKDIKYHFLHSESSRFWKENLSKTTSDARKEKIYSPRLEWMADMVEEYSPQAKNIADLCNRNKEYVSDFLGSSYFENKIIVNPYYDASGVQIIDSLDGARKNKGSMDVVSAFEVIDYTVDIDEFFRAVNDMLMPGGLCFLTTISISGFDLQVLWNNSKSIFPLDRINVLSNKGLNLLFKRHDFEILEYSTPGLLDLDIVKNAIEGDKKVSVPKFVRTLIEQGDEQLYKDFQEFLQINRLSSFARILLRKN